MLLFLQLPAFPPITRHSLLHPALLSLRYLTDANLPGNRPRILQTVLQMLYSTMYQIWDTANSTLIQYIVNSAADDAGQDDNNSFHVQMSSTCGSAG